MYLFGEIFLSVMNIQDRTIHCCDDVCISTYPFDWDGNIYELG